MPGPSRSLALPLGVVLVAGLLGLAPLWSGHGIVYSPCSDIIAEHLANMEVYARSIRDEGRFPLWNPAMNCGAPAFANPQSMILYPLSALYLILAPDRATNCFILASFLASGAGAFLLSRRLFGHVWVSAFCAVAYMLSFRSFCMIYAGWLPKMPMFTLAPFLFWAAARVVDRTSPGRLSLLAIFIALGWVQGDMQLFAYCIVAVAVMVLASALRLPRRDAARMVLATSAAVALGTLIAAPAILPRIEFVRLSTRTTPDYQFFLSQSAGAGDLSTLFDPRDNGGRRMEFWEDNFYFGLALYPLCVVGLFACWRRALLPAIAVLAALVLCFNTPLLRFLFDYLPGFALFRQPSRALILAQLAVIVLAGHGLYALIESRSTPTQTRRLAGLIAILGVGLLLFTAATRAGAVSFVLAGAVAAAAATVALAPGCIVLAVAIFAALPVVDAVVRMYPRLRTASLDEAFPPAPFHAGLVRSPTSGRTAAIGRTAIPYGQAGWFQIDLLNGYASLNLRHYFDYLVVLQTGRTDGAATVPMVWTEFVAAARPDMLRALDIRHIVANEPLSLEAVGYRLASSFADVPVFDFYQGVKPVPVCAFDVASPPAAGIFAQSLNRVADSAASLAAIASTPATVADVLGDPPTGPFDFKGGTIELTRRGLNVYEYAIDARGREFAMLPQVWYPGWRATLDNAAVPVYRVNHALVGCALPPGPHKLILEMTSPSLRYGLWISGGAAAVLLAINLVQRSRQGRAAAPARIA